MLPGAMDGFAGVIAIDVSVAMTVRLQVRVATPLLAKLSEIVPGELPMEQARPLRLLNEIRPLEPGGPVAPWGPCGPTAP